ncbi:MAG: anaerobic ribonucleoside-triphosphate reductase activating protein [Clostridia bacterium]|nr:anaerobic ribonucleoside-triphosphate reductase activating protein [Clostridia bacterium]
MQLSGLQKLTLLDYPGKVACTVFTNGCNFRCPFCHNASLVTQPTDATLTEDELLSFLKKRQGILEGVVFTGGEPLLHADLPALFERIKALGYPIKLDTNGTQPKRLKQLLDNRLVDRVAMDIKHSPTQYSAAVGLPHPDMEAVTASKNLLMNGDIVYEFRTTVVKGIHTKESLIELAQWIRGAREYYLQQFKDSGNLIAPDGLGAFSDQELLDFAKAVRPYVPSVQVRGTTTR